MILLDLEQHPYMSTWCPEQTQKHDASFSWITRVNQNDPPLHEEQLAQQKCKSDDPTCWLLHLLIETIPKINNHQIPPGKSWWVFIFYLTEDPNSPSFPQRRSDFLDFPFNQNDHWHRSPLAKACDPRPEAVAGGLDTRSVKMGARMDYTSALVESFGRQTKGSGSKPKVPFWGWEDPPKVVYFKG